MSNDIVKTIQLKHPLEKLDEKGNKSILNTLRVSRIKVKHLKLLPAGFGTQDKEKQLQVSPAEFIPLIASLANISEELADEIDFEDLFQIVDLLNDLLGK